MRVSPPRAGRSHTWQLLMLSAKSELALESGTGELIRFLRSPEVAGLQARGGNNGALADVSFTLLAGRELFDRRKALVCAGIDDAIEVLQGSHPLRLLTQSCTARNRPVAFFFPDQDLTSLDMAGAILASQPVFRTEVERCIGLIDQPATCDGLWRLFSEGANAADAQRSADQAALVQIACFVFEYALARLWQSWGLHAEVLIGEGAGECVAAHLAGCISLDDALYLSTVRGRLLQHGRAGVAGAEVASRVRAMAPAAPRMAYISAASGCRIEANDVLGSEHWLELVHRPVRAGMPLASLAREIDRVMLDVGSGRLLDPVQEPAGLGDAVRADAAADGLCWMLATLAGLAVSGVKIDWKVYFADQAVKRISLPTYCFEPRGHWFAAPEQARAHAGQDAGNPRTQTARWKLEHAVDPGRCATAPQRTEGRARGETASLASRGHGQVEAFLIDTCQQLLGINPIGLHDNVMQMGMDSMNVMQLSLKIEEAFKLSIAPHHLFSKPHIGSLVEKILALRPDLKTGPAAALPAKPVARPRSDERGHSADATQMLRFVENLSDLEVDRLLKELGASQGNDDE